ncbi:MAG: four helix bundle protein [Bacteroidales bacterium]|nr:four helix bundle protein [Bacteroidales bacterium]
MNSFKELEVWKACRELRLLIWKLVKSFPNEEKYRLTDQMISASRSATTQIAEGYGRFHFQENIQFCRISRGSLFELIDHLTVALDSEYISDHEYNDLEEKTARCIQILNGYINYLVKAKDKYSGNQTSEPEEYYGAITEP